MPQPSTPEEEWLKLLKARVTKELGVTLFALGISNKGKFSAKRGMNNLVVQDAEVIALLTKMNTVDSSIDIDINGNDADQLRELQIAAGNVNLTFS